MKKLCCLALLLLTACVPTAGSSTEGVIPGPDRYWMTVLPSRHGQAAVAYTIPAEFPNSSREVRALLTCPSGQWSQTGTLRSDVEAFLAYPKTNPEFHLEDGSLEVKGHRVSCEGAALRLQGPSLPSAIGLMVTRPTESIGADRGELVFRAFEGYVYPNLRLDPYWSVVRVTIGPRTVSARLSDRFRSGDAVVALRQGSETTPVLFERSTTNVGYEASLDATLYVSRGRDADVSPQWDVVSFNYSEGWLTWQLTHEPPPME